MNEACSISRMAIHHLETMLVEWLSPAYHADFMMMTDPCTVLKSFGKVVFHLPSLSNNLQSSPNVMFTFDLEERFVQIQVSSLKHEKLQDLDNIFLQSLIAIILLFSSSVSI